MVTAFANSSLFLAEAQESYVPFMPLAEVRAMFDNSTKVCMAIGGWGDTDGFSKGSATNATRAVYARKVAQTMTDLGYDCVDVDWEYPGGNGQDYKLVPNSNKTTEVANYPLLLQAIKTAIGGKELSIAVPGLKRDMMAYCNSSVPRINTIVDFVNVMSYDLMNRRDNVTKHHTSIKGSLEAVDTYIERGFTPSKLTLGFAFYAKFFTLANSTATCDKPTGCATALLENPIDGSDTGLSGAMTFEASNFAPVPSNLTVGSGTCGQGTFFKCAESDCCSQYGSCGTSDAHCGLGCQNGYGKECQGFSVADSFKSALANGSYDEVEGGHWYIDQPNHIFWTWDTPEEIHKKYTDIVVSRQLGGVMAWSLAEDSYGWDRLRALQAVMTNSTTVNTRSTDWVHSHGERSLQMRTPRVIRAGNM